MTKNLYVILPKSKYNFMQSVFFSLIWKAFIKLIKELKLFSKVFCWQLKEVKLF